MNHRTRTLAGIAALLGVLIACDPPTHPRNYANTIFTSLCHFQYDCCTPSERAAFAQINGASTKERCLEELNDSLGGFMSVPSEAVDRGTAIYDAEAAERCTADLRTASDQCDAAAFVSPNGGFAFNSIVFLVSAQDAECQALALRGFTRGTVKDGDDCLSDIECADFGACVVADDDEDGLVVAGTCQASLAEGAACAEVDASCLPGLVCGADGCEVITLANDGDACEDNDVCASGFCTASDGGACEGSGDSCEEDFECGGSCVGDLCVGSGDACVDDFDCEGVCTVAPGECATRTITVDVCDGL